MHGPVIADLDPGAEQPVQLGKVCGRRPGGAVADAAGDLDQELLADGAEEPLDFPAALGLTGQSWVILWITSGPGGLLPGVAAGSLEAADGFLVATDLGGDGFEAAAELVDLDGQAGQGGGVAAVGSVVLDDGAQVGPPVEGGAADLGAGGDCGEGDGLPGGGKAGAGGFDLGQFAVSWHGPG
jgi:hypothetical protein